MYQLFCDSNCELWHTEAKELGLCVIRMPYVLDGEEPEHYTDLAMTELDGEEDEGEE
jgi:hypothetical protein